MKIEGACFRFSLLLAERKMKYKPLALILNYSGRLGNRVAMKEVAATYKQFAHKGDQGEPRQENNNWVQVPKNNRRKRAQEKRDFKNRDIMVQRKSSSDGSTFSKERFEQVMIILVGIPGSGKCKNKRV